MLTSKNFVNKSVELKEIKSTIIYNDMYVLVNSFYVQLQPFSFFTFNQKLGSWRFESDLRADANNNKSQVSPVHGQILS